MSGCRGTPSPATAAAPPRNPVVQLQTNISALLADPALERAIWGIAVRSLASGNDLYSLGARKLLMPASAMKIVTLATAAERLGWDYTYETRVVAGGQISAGTLVGDLVIVGSGDPSLDDWDGAATRVFRSWAQQLKAAGVTRITGGIVGDDKAFDEENLGAGWAWDDLGASYATGVGALQFNENTAQLVFGPGGAVDEAASVVVRPPQASLRFRSQVRTSPATQPAMVMIRPVPSSGVLELRGSVPLHGPPLIRNVSVGNPTQYFVNSVRATLVAEGIAVEGPAADIGEVTAAPSRPNAQVLIRHRSPPLSALAVTMMKLSQNLYAETLLKTLGAQSAGVGSTEAGRTAALHVLEAWGLAPAQVQMADGSGLSRYNLVTPGALVDILVHVYRDEGLRRPFQATLPVAGVDGTLAQRLKGTAAEGNALAKTGSILSARAVAGYVRTADAEPLAFVVIANNYGVSSDAIDKTADAIVVALAEFKR
jgi:D-alanyl-D-alanine carboxypeptidase/D-alanyl-D-alanine-endopeptidase (penicillin-binding protein 4)